jgi:hypothetical protein
MPAAERSALRALHNKYAKFGLADNYLIIRDIGELNPFSASLQMQESPGVLPFEQISLAVNNLA